TIANTATQQIPHTENVILVENNFQPSAAAALSFERHRHANASKRRPSSTSNEANVLSTPAFVVLTLVKREDFSSGRSVDR
ncbi:MAG: hypothetical protein P4M11_14740, partial [Candidatus Pacebacteria bacterium]|nr:hypothetical protein [Candidatus Paceibacterota bacterium]